MNKLADDHQARLDAAMLASRASNHNGGIRTPDDAENASESNLAALIANCDHLAWVKYGGLCECAAISEGIHDDLVRDAAWDECISDDDWKGKR